MVDIRVAVEDVTRVPALVGRHARIFERSSTSFDRSRNEVGDCEYKLVWYTPLGVSP